MDYRKRLLELRDFLKPYQRIWQNEIMLQYPEPCRDYPQDWIEDLVRFQEKSIVIRLEKKDVFPFIASQTLRDFYQRIDELTQLPGIPELPPMPEDHWTWLNMIPKKQHEIRKLAPYLNELYHELCPEALLDIGGGVGLLAQCLNNHYGHKVISLDMNSEFQKIGEERQLKNHRHVENQVRYVNMKVAPHGVFTELLSRKLLPIGLHTCGRLALDILRVSAAHQVPALVNFGCCYHTLDVASELQNLSQFAHDNDPLWLNKYALTLSCRAHKKMSEKDFDFKLVVKRYRYAIHILFHREYGLPEVLNLGNSHHTLYNRPFHEYAREQFKRINLPLRHTNEDLDAFYQSPELHQTIQEMLAAGLIRNALGRALEVYLLLDRGIFLEEKGYNVTIAEFFDEEVSPRNIGIVARKRN